MDFVADDPAYAGTMTMTWEVTAVDGGTRFDIRADDVPDGISADHHATGLASSLANLAAYVEQQLAPNSVPNSSRRAQPCGAIDADGQRCSAWVTR